MIECPSCPRAVLVESPTRDHTSDQNWRCPVETCYGWVCEVEDADATFFGCGECGNVWADRTSLSEAITAIVKKRKYRRKAYQKVGDGWISAQPGQEPPDYDELIRKEWN